MEADQHSWTARTGDGGQVAGGSAFYTLPLVVLEMIVLGLHAVGDPLKSQGVTKAMKHMLGHFLLKHQKKRSGSQSYQFLHCLSHVVLAMDHGHHVLVNGRRQNNIQGFSFHRHVADHLVMGEHIVSM